jgi:hypothetical protein
MKKKLVPIRFPPNLEEMLDTGKAALTKMLGGACSAMAQSAASQDDSEQQHSQLPGGSQAGVPSQVTMKVSNGIGLHRVHG